MLRHWMVQRRRLSRPMHGCGFGVDVGFGRAREEKRRLLVPIRGGESENRRDDEVRDASFEMWSIACLACESSRGPCSSVIGQLRHSELVLRAEALSCGRGVGQGLLRWRRLVLASTRSNVPDPPLPLDTSHQVRIRRCSTATGP
jgi:hypothetical protein